MDTQLPTDLVTDFFEQFFQPLQMVALDLNCRLLNRSASTASIFQPSQKVCEMIAGMAFVQSSNDGDDLALLSFFNLDFGRLFFWRNRLRFWRRAIAV